ncbi:MAG: flavodoxin domain-containing protein [Cyclobacteriaceae bacterium]
MLVESRLQQLHEFVSTFSKEELVWINGYLSGLLQNGHAPQRQLDPVGVAVKRITILYGTETGNAKKLGYSFASSAKKKGISTKLMGLDQYRLTDLAKEEYFFLILSTHGEGEPPAAAKKFYNFIHEEDISLSNLKFAVLGLGDTSYPLFCKAAEDVDGRLSELGAHCMLPLQKCDVDYEEQAAEWLEKIYDGLRKTSTGHSSKPIVTEQKIITKKIYKGRIAAHINLNDNRSSKETFHIEIRTDDRPDFQPGDAIGIYPHNRVDIVDKIIAITGIDPSKKVTTPKATASVQELLTKQLNISYLSSATVQKHARIVGTTIPETRMDLLDLLRIYPVKNPDQFEEVIAILNPHSPRLYSIASSPSAHDGEVHLTVARNIFNVSGEHGVGLCSDFLCSLNEDDTVGFYVHKNRDFKLPAAEKDIIMIGPGTGIAPFRSFVAERDAIGATGRNWLFFGDRNFTTDFLYQTEWQQYMATGVLTKINLAWSRDTATKYYVQDELKKEAYELTQWLDNGAYVYICGNKDPMSRDVEEAIMDILCQQKNISRDEATQFLDHLSDQGRYVKDVY